MKSNRNSPFTLILKRREIEEDSIQRTAQSQARARPVFKAHGQARKGEGNGLRFALGYGVCVFSGHSRVPKTGTFSEEVRLIMNLGCSILMPDTYIKPLVEMGYGRRYR